MSDFWGNIWAGITNPIDAVNSALKTNEAHSHGFETWDDYQAWQAKQPQEQSNLPQWQQDLNKSPIVQALAPLAQVGVGTSFDESGNVSAPTFSAGTSTPVTNTQGNLNTDQVANDASDGFQATQHTILPQNPSSTLVGSSSYNPLTPQSINKVGYHNVFGDIDQGPSVGLTPITSSGPHSVNPDGTYAGQPTNASPGFVQTGGGPTQVADSTSGSTTTTSDAATSTSKDPNLGDIAKGVGAAVTPFLPLVSAAGNMWLTGKAAEDASTAAINAGNFSAGGYNAAQGVAEQQFQQQQRYQNPYITAALGNEQPGGTYDNTGALAKLQTFDADHPFNYNQNADPGYQFRLSEGLKALQNGAGAAGTLFGGNTIKAANNYAQDSASQEYQNAFNRFNTTTQNQRAGLQDIAHMGQTASNEATNASQQYANTSGNDFIGAANARANAQIGAANVNSSAYTNMGAALNAGVSAYLNNQQNDKYLNVLSQNKTGA